MSSVPERLGTQSACAQSWSRVRTWSCTVQSSSPSSLRTYSPHISLVMPHTPGRVRGRRSRCRADTTPHPGVRSALTKRDSRFTELVTWSIWEKLAALALPYWLAGAYASRELLGTALEAGPRHSGRLGICLCEESGFDASLKRAFIESACRALCTCVLILWHRPLASPSRWPTYRGPSPNRGVRPTPQGLRGRLFARPVPQARR